MSSSHPKNKMDNFWKEKVVCHYTRLLFLLLLKRMLTPLYWSRERGTDTKQKRWHHSHIIVIIISKSIIPFTQILFGKSSEREIRIFLLKNIYVDIFQSLVLFLFFLLLVRHSSIAQNGFFGFKVQIYLLPQPHLEF